VRGGTIVIISTDTKTRHREQRWKDVDCCESVALSSCTISPATPPLLRVAAAGAERVDRMVEHGTRQAATRQVAAAAWQVVSLGLVMRVLPVR